MLRADRNTAQLIGVLSAHWGMKDKTTGRPLTAADFDPYNRNDEPAKEPTVEDFMRVLGSRA